MEITNFMFTNQDLWKREKYVHSFFKTCFSFAAPDNTEIEIEQKLSFLRGETFFLSRPRQVHLPKYRKVFLTGREAYIMGIKYKGLLDAQKAVFDCQRSVILATD